jgi:hypothetical protein
VVLYGAAKNLVKARQTLPIVERLNAGRFSMIITNASEALKSFPRKPLAREMVISGTRKAPTGDGFFHPQIINKSGEVYYLKFTKQPYRPKDSESRRALYHDLGLLQGVENPRWAPHPAISH